MWFVLVPKIVRNLRPNAGLRIVVYPIITFPKASIRIEAYDPARAYEQWQKLGVKCLDSPSLVFEASSFEPLDSFIRTLNKANSGN